ncbi:MAG: phage major capsid protein [Rudaea sp.]|uniref:phage major capsid protein n=1 Tax=Rudaea sp. TaxID=2136325 RepID=UPI0039E4C7B1
MNTSNSVKNFLYSAAINQRGTIENFSTAECFGAMIEENINPRAAINPFSLGIAKEFDERSKEVYGQPQRGSFYMPFGGVMRSLDSDSASPLIASPIASELIQSLTANSAVIKNGARVISNLKNGTLYFPRVANGAQVDVITEWQSPNSGDPSFDKCQILPFTIAASFDVSRQLSNTSAFRDNLIHTLSGDLQKRIFSELDRLIIAGPDGVFHNADISTYAAGANGAAPSLANLTDIEDQLGAAYSGTALTWFINSAMRRSVRKTATGAGLSPLWNGKNQLLGYETEVTEHVPGTFSKGTGTNLSGAVLGDFSQIVIGLWGPGFELKINPTINYGAFTRITAFLDCGFGFIRNEAFVACSDFIT